MPDVAAPPPAHSISARLPTEGLTLFATRLQELLAATDESMRRQLEDEVLSLAVPLHAAGLFEILNVANTAAATMISDHVAQTG